MGSGKIKAHWLLVGLQILTDIALMLLGYFLAAAYRFDQWLSPKLGDYFPAVGVGALTFGIMCYIFGLYDAVQSSRWSWWRRQMRVATALGIAIGVIMMIGSLNFSSRVGRGVMLYGLPLSVAFAGVHHWLLALSYRKRNQRRVACIVAKESDERGVHLFCCLEHGKARFLGLVAKPGYTPGGSLPVLGRTDELNEIVAKHRVEVLLVRDAHMTDPELGAHLRRQRFAGMEISSLADACEEVYHAMPLELVSDAWLIRASSQPGLLYIKKAKRMFDILLSCLLAIPLILLLLLGILLVKISSPGPVFFSQMRSGRFGRPFRIWKLRTMHVQPDDAPPQWTQKDDPRLFRVGKLLRVVRIDEIPQIWNILRGHMSFVGPRPERPEFIEQLAAQIPFYAERMMVQPGLTGWAQVRYPYGASVEDARRKLEYDLYYVKHMGLLLDAFILLDTFRIVLTGGVRQGSWKPMADFTDRVRGVLNDATLTTNPRP
jgi:exopolysaccharide biosynthesis polyprenyl glycosylphosphotransferase